MTITRVITAPTGAGMCHFINREVGALPDVTIVVRNLPELIQQWRKLVPSAKVLGYADWARSDAYHSQLSIMIEPWSPLQARLAHASDFEIWVANGNFPLTTPELKMFAKG